MHKKLMTVIFFLILFLIPIISLIMMSEEESVFSENENRYLAGFPRYTFDRIMEGEFTVGFENWANDRVFGRINWIKFKNKIELTLGKTEISGVFITDERMVQAWKDYDAKAVSKNLDAMNQFAERHDVPVYFMLAPTSQEIYRSTLPDGAPAGSQKDFIKYCYDYLSDITPIDVLPVLDENSERYIYYRTDHHWTSLGAYIAYSSAAPAMGFTPLDMGRFNIEHASSSFQGTLYSKTLNSNITSDIIDIYTLSEGEPEVTVKVDGGNSNDEYQSLYFREYIDAKDKYSTYLGIIAPVVEIKPVSGGSGKRLLIFKDSYAHCLIPFLAKNYSEITMVDMRNINMDYNGLVNISDYDQVLFMYNVITFSEDRNLTKLNMGVKRY